MGDEHGELDPGTVATAFGLGGHARWSGAPEAGKVGVVRRLDTDRGSWAVKVADRPVDVAALARQADLQDRVRAAGVLTPEVVRTADGAVTAQVNGRTVQVLSWLELGPVDRSLDPVGVGRLVAALHRVALPADGAVEEWFAEPVSTDRWHGLVDELYAAGAPFADRLSELLPELVAVSQLAERYPPVQVCHLDLFADNVRALPDGRLCVFDWDNAGPGDPSQELAVVLFEYGCGDADRVADLYAGYLAAGGPGRVRDLAGFTQLIAQLGHILEVACRRWLAATDDAARADHAAWAAEFLDEPLTVDGLQELLDVTTRVGREIEPSRYEEPEPAPEPQVLVGGDVTDELVRIGDTVRRPWDRHAPLVRAVLRYLEEAGFEGAPRFLGVDAADREVLSYLPGEVASRPRPDWFRDRDRLASVAILLRRYHAAVAGFNVSPALADLWVVEGLPPGIPDVAEPLEVLGHQDITPENVVFRDGEAVALIDFDLARPTSVLLEVVNTLVHWGQLAHPQDREPAMSDEEVFARCRVFVDAYGLDRDGRERLAALAAERSRRSWHLMEHRARVSGGGWQRMWDQGVGDVINRRVAWLTEEGPRLTAALLDELPDERRDELPEGPVDKPGAGATNGG